MAQSPDNYCSGFMRWFFKKNAEKDHLCIDVLFYISNALKLNEKRPERLKIRT